MYTIHNIIYTIDYTLYYTYILNSRSTIFNFVFSIDIKKRSKNTTLTLKLDTVSDFEVPSDSNSKLKHGNIVHPTKCLKDLGVIIR